jgi:hypothetical protein
MTSFRKNKLTLIELHVDGNCTDDLLVMSLKLLLSTFIQRLVALQNRLFPYQLFLLILSRLFLLMTLTFKKPKKTETSQICPNDVTDFIIVGWSTISLPVRKYIFSLIVSKQHLQTQWGNKKISNRAVRRNVIRPDYKIIDLYRFLKIFQKVLNLL